jgi:chromosome segregation ATPase
MGTKITAMKKDYERRLEELESKCNTAEEHKKEISRQQVSAESEFDKQKALLDQKLEFLDKALEDSQRREKELSTELKNSKKDFFAQNKEQQQALEKQIKEQAKKIEDMKEQVYEWENKHTELELVLEDFKSTSEN